MGEVGAAAVAAAVAAGTGVAFQPETEALMEESRHLLGASMGRGHRHRRSAPGSAGLFWKPCSCCGTIFTWAMGRVMTQELVWCHLCVVSA